MIRQLLVGGATSACNIAIHALVMAIVVRASNAIVARPSRWPTLTLIWSMIATVMILMAAHTLEVMVWALIYAFIDAAPAGANLVYFAFVNYTTLGYGDVVPVQRWQLIGPITAMNGILMFGWSTAVIFEVLRKNTARIMGQGRHQ
jgi:hypothetical protein